jgi:hypothetical protein
MTHAERSASARSGRNLTGPCGESDVLLSPRNPADAAVKPMTLHDKDVAPDSVVEELSMALFKILERSGCSKSIEKFERLGHFRLIYPMGAYEALQNCVLVGMPLLR